MKILNPFVILFTLYISSFLCRAQEVITSPKDWQEEVFQEGNDFKTMQVKFSEYWQDKEPGKGSGYKQFKRWERRMERRLNSEGNIVGPSHIWDEYANYKSTHPVPKSSSTGQWVEMGPVKYPDYEGEASYGQLGKIIHVGFHPFDSNILYVCAEYGGLWKSLDNGVNWVNLTDEFAFNGAARVLVHPENPNIIYYASGVGNTGTGIQPSMGVMKSTNGGEDWSATGLAFESTELRTISDLVFHPDNPEIIYAMTNNGVYKTSNGGTDWDAPIFPGKHFVQLVFHPSDSDVMYLVERGDKPLRRSVDGGSEWTNIVGNLDIEPGYYNLRIAVCPAAADNLYISTYINPSDLEYSGFGGLYVSTNKGDSFVKKSSSPNILNQSLYGSGYGSKDNQILIDPTDKNIIYVGGGHVWKSTDQGVTWVNKSFYGVHPDQRYIGFHPITGDFYSGNDGGLNRSKDSTETWELIGNNLSIGQTYFLSNHPTDPNQVMTAYQDNGTHMRRSDGTWKNVYGGDGSYCQYDFENPSYRYLSYQKGNIFRSANEENGPFQIIMSRSYIKETLEEKSEFFTPFVLHPDNANTMFIGLNNVYRKDNVRTASLGDEWTKVGNTGLTKEIGLIEISDSFLNNAYVATKDTILKTSSINNPFSVWTNVELPFTGKITDIEAGTQNIFDVFVCRGGIFTGGEPNERVFYSSNGGMDWTNITGSLPNFAAEAIVQDKNTGVLYIGMEIGVYRYDWDAEDWVLFSEGLPNCLIEDLEIYYDECNPEKNRLRAATYGRGTWESELFQPELQHKATLPYSTGFELGLDEFWTTHSEEGTLIETSGDYEPRTGTRSLVMASESIGSTQLRNDARLHLDLSDETQVELRFWWREYHDEYSTNAITGDGIYFSDDGGENFQKTPVILNGSNTNEWFEAVLDVDEIAEDLGLELNCNFVIKFQQIDNYPISLGTSSSDGLAFDDISVVSYADLPYYTGFDLGKFDQYWTSGSDVSNGVVEISTFESPVESHHLLMYSTENGTFAKNYADLHLNLEGISDATLTFKWKDFGDEDHAEDAIYFSNNGGKDFEFIGNLWTSTNDTYVTKTYDIDFWATLRDLTLTDQFVIRFQQYDDYGLGWDGFAFDEINVFTGTEITESPFPITENAAAQNFDFILFPNPAKENITVVFNSDTEEQVEWSIYNIMGQQLITQNTVTVEGQNRIEIDLTTLINGTYFFKVIGQKTSTQKKFIIDK